MRNEREWRWVTILLCASCLVCGCSSFRQHAVTQGQWYRAHDKEPWKYQRVAVLGLEKDPLFQQSLTIAFLNKGVDVVEREKIDEILREGTVAGKWADLSDQEKAKALGRLLKVDALVLAGVMHDYYNAMTKQQYKHQGGVGVFATNSALLSPFPRAHVIAEYGATWRVIDIATGEIVCVGGRILSVRQKAEARNLNSLSPLELIRVLCLEIVDDVKSAESGSRDKAIEF